MKIRSVDLAERILVIAEIGNNHEGDPALARELVAAAIESGVGAVKIQVIDPEKLVHVSQVDRIAQLNKFRLSRDTISELAALARSRDVLFIASAFDPGSLAKVLPYIDAVKIASGDMDHHPLLCACAASGRPLILSTGMSTMEEIRRSVGVISSVIPAGVQLKEALALLHCASLYPLSPAEANLRSMVEIGKVFGVYTGYSDHCLGIEVAIVAVALGARIIEKHFTLDKSRTSFRDHALSADPADMKRLVEFVNAMPGMLGSGIKCPSASELKSVNAVRRGVVAARNLAKGELLQTSDIEYVRPRRNLTPADGMKLVGRRLKTSLDLGDYFEHDNVE